MRIYFTLIHRILLPRIPSHDRTEIRCWWVTVQRGHTPPNPSTAVTPTELGTSQATLDVLPIPSVVLLLTPMPPSLVSSCCCLLLFDNSLDGLGGRPSTPQVASHRGRCVGCARACVCVYVDVVGEPGGALAQGGTLAASPEEDRDVGGLLSPKTVSPATTRRLLPGRFGKLFAMVGVG